jgi:inner membrane protein
MDSITQAALGAAIGEAALGKKIGYKAPLWGAVIGTLPDLDVLAYPFISEMAETLLHRGFTHSFFFVVLASPIIGWAINKIHHKEAIGWKTWSWFSFWCLITHILIDLPTSYGTQIFWPFDRTPLTTDAIFIIDPLFTIPLFFGVLLAQFRNRDSRFRLWINRTGLLLSTLYLIWAHGIKAHVHSVFDQSFKNQYASYERIKTLAAGPTTLMWVGYITRNDSVYAGVYSILDDDPDITFRGVAKNSHKLEPFIDDEAIQILMWFSRGYIKTEEKEGGVYLHDLRFGRSDFWLTDQGEYIWSNKLRFNADSTRVTGFESALPVFDFEIENRNRIWNRLWGE